MAILPRSVLLQLRRWLLLAEQKDLLLLLNQPSQLALTAQRRLVRRPLMIMLLMHMVCQLLIVENDTDLRLASRNQIIDHPFSHQIVIIDLGTAVPLAHIDID